MTERAYLTIKEIDLSDVGKNIAKIDPLIFEKMKLNIGDTIKITSAKNSKSAVAIAVKGKVEDTATNVVRIDGTVRQNVGSSIDEEISVEKIECHLAKAVNLTPIVEDELKNNQIISQILKQLNREDIKNYIKESLLHKNFIEGNTVKIPKIKIPSVRGESKDLQLIVTKGLPKGPIRIVENTKISIEEKPEVGVLGITYDDVGGLKKEIDGIREMVELPIRRPEIFRTLGITPPKGVLLYGAPGTGKTLLAKAVASETDAYFKSINGPEIVTGVYGKSEENLRSIFKEAEEKAPAIIFIDEIDAIAPKREDTHGDTEKRIVAQLLTLMDGLSNKSNVVVIATTNRPNSIDPALRRPGRFDREIEFGIPDKEGREEILKIHTRNMKLDEDVNLNKLVELTNGFSGADLQALCKEAALKTIKRLKPKIDKEIGESLSESLLNELVINQKDFEDALHVVEPSAIREVQVQIPDVRWNDIGGLDKEKQFLKEMIDWPINHKEVFAKIGVKPPTGVLLYGPPGTGKTMLAKAIATESNSNFISIKGSDIFNKWVGESEKKVREIFKKARLLAPSIVFFDEIDAITSRKSGDNITNVTNNVVAELLTEIDGVSKLSDVIVVGATNRIDLIDDAFLRSGRFDRLVYVSLPNFKDQEKIFDVYLSKITTDKGINSKELVKMLDENNKYSGADIAAICNEAAMICIRRIVSKKNTKEVVTKEDFRQAIDYLKTKQKEDEGSYQMVR